MLDKLASIFGSGVGDALDKLKKLVVDTWHIDPAKAAELDLEAKRIAQEATDKLTVASVKLLEIDAADRNSARQREMSVKDNTNANLAYTVTGVMMGGVVYFNIFPPEPEVKAVVENVMMAVRDGWLVILAYYFGSSRGSAAKHDMIDKLVSK